MFKGAELIRLHTSIVIVFILLNRFYFWYLKMRISSIIHYLFEDSEVVPSIVIKHWLFY